MTEATETARQRYATALRTMCQIRGIAPTGSALAAALRAAGVSIHPHTLQLHLTGQRSPQRGTIDCIARGLHASEAERLVLLGYDGDPAARPAYVVSVRDVLRQDVDKGRDREHVLWRYEIGHSDEEDRCVEVRRTDVGSDGLRSAGFGPGQLDALAFDILDVSRLSMMVRAQRLSSTGAPEVPVSVHLVELDAGANRYHWIARFEEEIRNETIAWTASYRWPGLWRSLRKTGVDAGTIGVEGSVDVRTATVELVASRSHFPGLYMIPTPDYGSMTRTESTEKVRITWRVEQPVARLNFEVRCPQHAAV